jgi:hypothetical protein
VFSKLGPQLLLKDWQMQQMRTQHIIYAKGSLRRFLIARAMGAPQDELLKLSNDAMAELEAERTKEGRSTLDQVVVDFNRARREQPLDKNEPPGEPQ